MSSTDGSPTKTCWNRRSSAGSFSMYLRNSSSVVAPIMRSSPRASIGLIMLPASTAPSAPPAPTIVCSSSTKVITSPSASAISFSTALRRSSNSPRYFEPATIDPMSSAMRRLSRSPSGTSPSTMRRASPSTIAVLPTPGSPMSTGLFLVRRDSTWMTRRISSSRPMTGSSLPLRASSVRSRPNRSSAWYWSSGFSLVTWWLPAHLLQRTEQRVVGDAEPAQEVADTAGDLGHREEHVLGGEVVVAEIAALAVGRLEHLVRVGRELRGLGRLPVDLRQLGDRLVDPVERGLGRDAEALEHGQHDALGLTEEGREQVLGRHLACGCARVPAPARPGGPRRSCG